MGEQLYLEPLKSVPVALFSTTGNSLAPKLKWIRNQRQESNLEETA